MSISLNTNTQSTATIDEKWDQDVHEAVYETAEIVPRVANKSDLVKNSGDIINVTVDARVAVQTVGSDGSFNITQTTPESIVLTIDQWKLTQRGTTDRAEAQSFWDINSTFPKVGGQAKAEDMDSAVAALYSGLSLTPVGTESDRVTFGKDAAASALLRIGKSIKGKIKNLNNLTFVLPYEAVFSGLLQETDFTDASMIGGGAVSPLKSGKLGMSVLGIPIAMTTLTSLVSGNCYKGMLIHREAFAIGIQLNNSYERFSLKPGGYAGKAVTMEWLYGVKTIRADHGVVININAVSN